jgi:hypothetical protein
MRARVTHAVLFLLLPGLICVDFLTGGVAESVGLATLPMSPGEVIRGTVFLVSGLALVRTRRRDVRPMIWGAVIVGLAIAPGVMRGLILGGGLAEVNRAFKELYGPVLIAMYCVLFSRYGIGLRTILRAEAAMGALAGVSLVTLDIFGLGRATYGTLSTAFAGLFVAQNDAGLMMSISLFAAMELALERKDLPSFGQVALIIMGLLVLGTRTGTLAAFCVPAAMLWAHRAEFGRRRRLPTVLATLILMAGGLTVAAVRQYQMITSEGFLTRKYESLFAGALPRAVLLAGGLKVVAARPAIDQLVGAGTVKFERGLARVLKLTEDRREVELDWMDLFGDFGLLGAVTVYGYYLFFARRFLALRRRLGTPVMWLGLMILGFFLLHATFAGHATASPLPLGAISPLFAFMWLASRRPLEQGAGDLAATTLRKAHGG